MRNLTGAALAMFARICRSASVLGTTTLTDTEIRELSDKYKQDHPLYLGFTSNCQDYSREIVKEMMKTGTQFQNLPLQESPVERVLPFAIGLFISFLFLFLSGLCMDW